jgi:hypothetical protein
MRCFALAALLLVAAFSALAADMTGTWAFSVDTPNGKRESTIDFKQDGEKLTGTVHGQMGDTPLAGSVKGSDVSWSVTREFNGQSFRIDYTGKVEGSKMSGNLKFGDQGEAPFTAEKK